TALRRAICLRELCWHCLWGACSRGDGPPAFGAGLPDRTTTKAVLRHLPTPQHIPQRCSTFPWGETRFHNQVGEKRRPFLLRASFSDLIASQPDC
ncbi:MAG: hypothetical protein J7J76_07470, partial [Candidatus Latescibacteria bacterium]|nr:hypothetical protein [Candidatus Latescibacterota bacterium]